MCENSDMLTNYTLAEKYYREAYELHEMEGDTNIGA